MVYTTECWWQIVNGGIPWRFEVWSINCAGTISVWWACVVPCHAKPAIINTADKHLALHMKIHYVHCVIWITDIMVHQITSKHYIILRYFTTVNYLCLNVCMISQNSKSALTRWICRLLFSMHGVKINTKTECMTNNKLLQQS